MNNHIQRLVDATEHLMVSYRYAYNDGPDIGVRGYNMNKKVDDISYQGCRDDTVVIDGIVWLIAGDICNIPRNARVWNLREMLSLDLDSLRVNVRAQAFVAGTIVTVDLGTRKVSERYSLDNGEGVISLMVK